MSFPSRNDEYSTTSIRENLSRGDDGDDYSSSNYRSSTKPSRSANEYSAGGSGASDGRFDDQLSDRPSDQAARVRDQYSGSGSGGGSSDYSSSDRTGTYSGRDYTDDSTRTTGMPSTGRTNIAGDGYNSTSRGGIGGVDGTGMGTGMRSDPSGYGGADERDSMGGSGGLSGGRDFDDTAARGGTASHPRTTNTYAGSQIVDQGLVQGGRGGDSYAAGDAYGGSTMSRGGDDDGSYAGGTTRTRFGGDNDDSYGSSGARSGRDY